MRVDLGVLVAELVAELGVLSCLLACARGGFVKTQCVVCTVLLYDLTVRLPRARTPRLSMRLTPALTLTSAQCSGYHA